MYSASDNMDLPGNPERTGFDAENEYIDPAKLLMNELFFGQFLSSSMDAIMTSCFLEETPSLL